MHISKLDKIENSDFIISNQGLAHAVVLIESYGSLSLVPYSIFVKPIASSMYKINDIAGLCFPSADLHEIQINGC